MSPATAVEVWLAAGCSLDGGLQRPSGVDPRQMGAVVRLRLQVAGERHAVDDVTGGLGQGLRARRLTCEAGLSGSRAVGAHAGAGHTQPRLGDGAALVAPHDRGHADDRITRRWVLELTVRGSPAGCLGCQPYF